MSKGKILFFYPNTEGYGGIPNGIALLAGHAKEKGYETKCFDITFLKSKPLDHEERQKYGGVIKSDASSVWGEWTPDLPKRIPELFFKIVEEFKPDLIAASFVEISYMYGIDVLAKVKEKFKIPIAAGGIFPTLSPEVVISNDFIDYVCIGEGEDPLVELMECIMTGKCPDNIKNLWSKSKTGKIVKNLLRPLKDMEDLSFQDWDIFDEKHMYKPYMGKFYRTAFIEMTRGCPYDCTYCCTANQRKIYRGLGAFVRSRSVHKTILEIRHLIEKYKIELVFFTDDNFLGMTYERLEEFCKEYKQQVDLPFYIQTRAETVKEEYIIKLKDVNLSTVAIGIEHGDEEYRCKAMNRTMSNKKLEDAFTIIHKYNVRTTANVMIGMPGELEETFQETIKLLRRIRPKSMSISYFQPFRGTKMRELAVKLGYISPDHIISQSIYPLEMKQFPSDRIKSYYDNFLEYVEGNLDLPAI